MNLAPFDQPGAAQHPQELVREWLKKAVGDFQTAKRELAVAECPNYDAVCFHAQQATEKTLKAYLEARGDKPPKLHDLVKLDLLVKQHASGWSFPIDSLSDLSAAAIESRYPGTSATLEQAEWALRTATSLWAAIRPLI
jgi:HEPN domain-containing protein